MTESVNTQICGTPILKRTEGENWINWNKLPVTVLTVLVSHSVLQINLLLKFLFATLSAKQKKQFCFIILLLVRHGVLWDNSCCLLPSVLGLKQHPYSLSCPSSSTPLWRCFPWKYYLLLVDNFYSANGQQLLWFDSWLSQTFRNMRRKWNRL